MFPHFRLHVSYQLIVAEEAGGGGGAQGAGNVRKVGKRKAGSGILKGGGDSKTAITGQACAQTSP